MVYDPLHRTKHRNRRLQEYPDLREFRWWRRWRMRLVMRNTDHNLKGVSVSLLKLQVI
jgi:hypothetical protein